jgi:hypothetical protein
MNPLVVGGGIAAVVAGPPLYALVQGGQLDGTSAFERWLIVAVLCVVGVSWVQKIMTGYEKEWRQKDREEAQKAADEAMAEAQRQADAQQAANQGGPGSGAGSQRSSS